jgi:hypothetical protein
MKTKKAITNEIGDQKRETGKKNEDWKKLNRVSTVDVKTFQMTN